MTDILIANDMASYMSGKSDGIIFKNIDADDLEILSSLSAKYNKQIKVVTKKTISCDTDENSNKADKRKIKKIFVTNDVETIKILPEQLEEYNKKGYHRGRK